jgi:hypothetical protein
MNAKLLPALGFVALLGLVVPAPAHANFGFSIALPGFGLFVHTPGPAVAYPPPVYVPPPYPPPYYPPAVAYYGYRPAPVFSGHRRGWYGRSWHGNGHRGRRHH